jgi:integrase
LWINLSGRRHAPAPHTAKSPLPPCHLQIDDALIEILLAEKKKHLQIAAGVPDGAMIDLGLVRLPSDALVFPGPPAPGESFSFTRLRDPDSMTKMFTRWATTLGFPGLRFHDLRAHIETMLLDNGTPIHVVAARCGHDPAVLLRVYASGRRRPTARRRQSSPRSLRRSSAAEDANSTSFT